MHIAVSSPNVSLEDYASDHINYLMKTFKSMKFTLIESTAITLPENIPAQKIVYKIGSHNGGTIKTMEVLTIRDNRAFIIRFGAESSKYNDYLSTAQKMMDSFQIFHVNKSTAKEPVDIEENEYDTYQNQAFGIKIQYPHTWRADEKHYYPENDMFTKVVGFISPKEDQLSPLKERVAVEVKNLPSENMSLDNYTALTINRLKKAITDFQVIESINTSLAGLISAHKLTYLDNYGYMVMKVYGILSSKVYIVTFYAESSKFPSYLPIAQKMIDSLEITAATDSHTR